MQTRPNGTVTQEYTQVSQFTNQDLRVNTIISLITGGRYAVSTTQDAGGVALDNGLFANPIQDPLLSEVNPITGTSDSFVTGSTINQLRTGDTLTVPAASSVDADTILVIELSRNQSTLTPSLNVTSGDFFQDENGNDNQIDFVGPARITLTSNGVNIWSL